MLNTPLAALSPTSAPETATKSDKPRHDTAGQAARDDTESGKGFSEFFQEADTSQDPKQASNDSQQIDLPDLPNGKPDQTTATSDGPISAESDLISPDLTDFEATLITPQTANSLIGTVGVGATGIIAGTAKSSALMLGQANIETAPAAILSNANAKNAVISATSAAPQLAPPADPNTLSPQNIAALNQQQTNAITSGALALQNAAALLNDDASAQIVNPTLRGPTIGGRTPEIGVRANGGHDALPSDATAQTKSAPPLAKESPPQTLAAVNLSNSSAQSLNSALTAPATPASAATAIPEPASGSGTAALTQTANANVQNLPAITSNLGQQRVVTPTRGRDSHTSLPPTADSAAIAARSKTATLANSNTGIAQTAASAQTYAFLNQAKPGEAEIEWQADAELAFDPKLDPRAAVSGTGIGTSRSDPVFQRPEIPRQVAAQLADIAQRMAGKSVQLSLNPEELGRVKLSLTPAETGMVVTVVAERGETLDLLRRNIDLLAQEFRAIGYDDISFSFGQQSSDSAGHSSDDTGDPPFPAARTDGPVVAEQQKPYQITLSPTDGIDIRV